MLPLGVAELFRAVQAKERCDLIVAGRVQQQRRPAEGRGGIAGSGEGVTGIMLAVPERSLPVLPRLAPVDGGESQQKSAVRQRGCGVAAVLQDVIAADVVVDAVRHTQDAAAD